MTTSKKKFSTSSYSLVSNKRFGIIGGGVIKSQKLIAGRLEYYGGGVGGGGGGEKR